MSCAHAGGVRVGLAGHARSTHVVAATMNELRTAAPAIIYALAIVTSTIANVSMLSCISNLPDIPDSPHQPGPGFEFPKRSFGKATVVLRSFQSTWFRQWPFLHYDKANDLAYCHTCEGVQRAKDESC